MAEISTADFLIVGGGIVGLATAIQLNRQFPGASICLLEKEPEVAAHQSGRNSGVLHSGIYYKPGSLKALTCRAGKKLMEEFCREHQVPFENCGKIVVAVEESEIERLERIFERGQNNGVDCRMVDRQQMLELEPHVAGIQAIHVPESGIVDYAEVCRKMAELLRGQGHRLMLGQEVTSISGQTGCVVVKTASQIIEAGFLITCGGLYSDRLVQLAGLTPPAQIVPFRGEYFEIVPQRKHLCRNLIYPVPDPNFPFLGVHFTRMIGGEVECGPNAVLALAREGYNWHTVRTSELWEAVRYPGFLKLARQHWQMGLGEMHRSLSKAAFAKALQRLIPEIRKSDLRPCRAGVRAQAMNPDGSLIDDFLWVNDHRMVHVCNAPSPAATASLEIGRRIVQRVSEGLQAVA